MSIYPILKCDMCGDEFECKHRARLKYKHIFCSRDCNSKFIKAKSELNCQCKICGKKFHLKPSRIAKSNNNYCSIDCHKIAKQQYMKGDKNHQFGLLGKSNASWKSDEKISVYGYRLIRMLEHPFKNCDGFVFEHRLMAEKYLLTEENSIVIDHKRYLKQDYCVHHNDYNRLNNDIDNLVVMLRSDHTRMHQATEWQNNNKKFIENLCRDSGIKYIDASEKRNGGFGSTDKK